MESRTESITLTLEKDMSWRMWHGYWSDGIVELGNNELRSNVLERAVYSQHWRFVDATDQEGFDVEHAFPSHKPDIDVFRPPLRTRKQRGWYHVSRHTDHGIPPRLADTTMSRAGYALASDLPPELFATIVDMTPSSFSPFRDMEAYQNHLRTLSLVCRLWSRLCASMMCTFPSVLSRAEFFDFCASLSLPDSRFRRALCSCTLRHDHAATPYIHLASRIDHLVHPRHYFLQVHLSGSSSSGAKPTLTGLRSIHGALPRAVPASVFSSRIVYVELKNIQFRCFADLYHLFAELPRCNKFVGCDLDWIAPPTLDLPAWRNKRTIDRIAMVQSKSNWTAALLGLRVDEFRGHKKHDATSMEVQGQLDGGDCHRVLALIEMITSNTYLNVINGVHYADPLFDPATTIGMCYRGVLQSSSALMHDTW